MVTAWASLRNGRVTSSQCARDIIFCALRIVKAARTGDPGDGKVFWYPVARAVRIRTGERDMEAITPAPSQAEEEL